ncbi:MAG: PQQ-dependent sugar dehydrogenase [Flavisolibacter sp.]
MLSLTAFRSLILCFFFSLYVNFVHAGSPPPSNDDPGGATALTIGTTNSGGTVKGATASTGIPAACSGTPDDDVWYSFTISSSTLVRVGLSNIGSSLSGGAMVQLFSGPSTSLVSKACGNTTVTSSLTAGTYYVRVYSSSATSLNNNAGFSITVTTTPGNDDCAGASTLTSNTTCSTITSSMDLATPSTGITAGCAAAGTHYDVWYQFVAAGTSETVTISNLGTSISNAEVQLFSGSCNTLTSLACGSSSATATGLTVNNTYYVRVSNIASDPSGFGTANFDICITNPSLPPSNDDCSSASALIIGTGSNGTVWAATDSGVPNVCNGTADDDVWYKFTPTATSATITLSGVGPDLTTAGADIQVFSGSCGALASIACGTSGMTVLGLTPGTTYYLRVYSAPSGSFGTAASGSVFTIMVTGPGAVTQSTVGSGRMNEVFQQTVLSGSNVLNYPWEITYGPDNKLWITESRGYKVYRMDPNTGAKTTVLDLSSGSTFLPSPSDSLNAVSMSTWNSIKWPQGGLAGLALHPKFLDGTGQNDYVYVSYVHRYLSGTTAGKTGVFFRNKLVRFTYNTQTNRLESPAVLCDTLPGSSDHNSQRIIIAPVVKNGTYYLFYAQGDMGAGQFENRDRPENAQHPASYEGKILRFNLVSDGESGANGWIPNDNPYDSILGVQSAVYSIGIRNNQGFAYDSSLNILYGASHGPYSDDEINVIQGFKNYGHPLIEGFVDGNYNGTTKDSLNTSLSAGTPFTDNYGNSTCPHIGDEAANKAAIDSSGYGLYKDPLFSAYAAPHATIQNIWQNNTANAGWPTEAWSGLDLYTHTLIPGWKKSLVAASLKWGRLVRLRLDATGLATSPTNTASDTISYFGSQNRFRDLAFAPNGKDIYVIMDNTSTTSGPGSANPVVPTCAGCVQKYTFLGYNTGGTGRSMIPTTIDVTTGTTNTCLAGTTITIDNTNNNLWVPITGPDGNIMAEIKANGNNLGTVTSSFYLNAGPVRENNLKRLYLDRNMTITPQTQPSSAVSIRLYLTASELAALKNASNSQGAGSGVTSIGNVSIYKNSDACGPNWVNTSTPLVITPTYAEAFGTNTYVLQASINSFSSFYFANTNTIILPLKLLSFTGALEEKGSMLQWETSNEINTDYFSVERSLDGRNFTAIGRVDAKGGNAKQQYTYLDMDALSQPANVLYYRLKMYDQNGSYAYSKIITVTLESASGMVSVYPNPMHEVLKIKVSLLQGDNVQVHVTDINGRTVYEHARFLGTGTTELQIQTKGWAAQMYSVRVTDSRNHVMAIQNVIKL